MFVLLLCRVIGVVSYSIIAHYVVLFFFFQAEDGIRDLVRSRGLGDVYKRQLQCFGLLLSDFLLKHSDLFGQCLHIDLSILRREDCLLYTSDAADERSSVDLGGRRIIKKNK